MTKTMPANAGDVGSIPGSGRSPEEGNSNSRQYSHLENPLDRGTWQATVHRFAQSRTQGKQLSTHAHNLAKLTCQLLKVFGDSIGSPA